jgi:hypothetical protein
MRAHAYDAWDAHPSACRQCGARDPHPDYRPAAILRDAVLGFLIIVFWLVACITGFAS